MGPGTASRGDGEAPLIAFVEAVNEQSSLEHRQWLGQLEKAGGALAALESALQKFDSGRKTPGAG